MWRHLYERRLSFKEMRWEQAANGEPEEGESRGQSSSFSESNVQQSFVCAEGARLKMRGGQKEGNYNSRDGKG